MWAGNQDLQAQCAIRPGCARDAARNSKGYLDPESTAHFQVAGDTNFTAHQFHEAARDGQPQSGAAKASRGGSIGLRKRGEQSLERGRLDADAGIGYLAAHTNALEALFRAENL